MSTFAVVGMTEHHAYQLARKSQPKFIPKQQRWETEEEYESRVAEIAEKHMTGERMSQISPMFDAPQFCEQFIEMARRQTRSRSLSIRRREKTVVTVGRKLKRRTTWHDYP